jgi:hypothetical protein
MDNDTEETYEAPPMHPYFSDWLRPTDLGIDRDTLKLRWAGIVQLRDEFIDWELAQDLIRLSLGRPLKDSDSLETFKEVFKSHDNMFPMKPGSNDAELINLASAYLAACLADEDNEPFATKLATLILATSFCSNRVFPEGPDLVIDSIKFASIAGASIRERSIPPQPILAYKIKDTTQEAINTIQVNQVEQIKTALNSLIGELTSHLNAAHNTVKKNHQKTIKQNEIRDEELEILWWIFGEQSQILSVPFTEIPELESPLLLGMEFAQRTTIQAELPSLKGLLRKIGVDHEGSIAFKDLIEANKKHSSILLDEDVYCPTLTPLLHALSITRESSTWQKQWEQNSGLSANIKASSVEWAEQIYRESLFLKHWS